jgi:hypothetical protein
MNSRSLYVHGLPKIPRNLFLIGTRSNDYSFTECLSEIYSKREHVHARETSTERSKKSWIYNFISILILLWWDHECTAVLTLVLCVTGSEPQCKGISTIAYTSSYLCKLKLQPLFKLFWGRFKRFKFPNISNDREHWILILTVIRRNVH